MHVTEFRSKIKPGVKLLVDDQDFLVKEVVKFRLDDGSFYIKCFLNDDYVFADDLNENMFVLVKETKTPFREPFPKELDFDAKKFKFLYAAHATAEEIWGEMIFKRGDSETFWDYKAEDNSYLSLGINDMTGDRMDYYGRIVACENVELR